MKRIYAYCIAFAIAGMALFAVQLAIAPGRALFAYTAAFAFGSTIASGALLLTMIMHVARASWFIALRRPTEAIASTVPLFLFLFVPIALGLRTLYPWMHARDYPLDVRRVLAHDAWLLNPGFFVVRAYAYMLLWSLLGWRLRALSLQQDASPDYRWTTAQRRLSAAGIPVLAITLTLAAFDWLMSLVPAFYSDIFGIYVFAAAFYGAMGAIALACVLAYRARLLPRAVAPAHFLAVGRVMLVATIFWAYIAFVQLLLIWIGNVPREVVFYVQRIRGAWSFFSGVQLFGHFVLTFLLLLSRDLKLRPSALAWLGVFFMLMHAVDLYWVTVPSAGRPSVLDCGPFLVIGGLLFAFGAWRFTRHAPFPINDPYLRRGLAYESP